MIRFILFFLISLDLFAAMGSNATKEIDVIQAKTLGSTPSTPGSGRNKIYVKGGNVKLLNSSGIENNIPNTNEINQFSKQNYVSIYTYASGASVDFDNGNGVQLSSPGGASITLSNIANGGTYNVIITDGTARTYSFTATKKESGSLTVKCSPALAATTASKHALFNFFRSGDNLYCTWVGDL